MSSTTSTSSVSSQNTVEETVERIRQILVTLLDRCQVPFEVKPYDQALHDECIVMAKERGYPMGTDPNVRSLLPFLPTGVYIASYSYRHLQANSARVFIALYTAFATYLDDLFKRDMDSVMLFHSRLIRHELHGDPVLDGFAQLLTETDKHFDHVAANIIVTDTLGFVNSLILDHEMDGLDISKNAVGLASFMRLMSGIPSAYMMFIFPAEIPVRKYVQAIPEMRNFICYLNDVMSFYKEEMRGEADNFISILSASQGLDKMTVLATLASDVAKSNDLIKATLRDEPDALPAWLNFMAGYVYFHTSNVRYKLDRLNL